jgi:hypothetical protein
MAVRPFRHASMRANGGHRRSAMTPLPLPHPRSGAQRPLILNVCYLSYTVNLGDTLTHPVDYFDWDLTVKKVPLVPFSPAPNVAALIIGGGGITRDPRSNMNKWLELRTIVDRTPATVPVVIWGMGINDHGRLDRRYDETLADLERRPNVLIGLRDSFYERHVPCASCMRPEFDGTFAVQHEVGFYLHHTNDIPFNVAMRGPMMSNQVQGDRLAYFGRVIEFLGSCETVITNSYHGAYWATLLNKRVVVLAPFSNKFVGLQHEPVIVKDTAWLTRARQDARTYPQALAESRRANRAFYDEVQAFRGRFADMSASPGEPEKTSIGS